MTKHVGIFVDGTNVRVALEYGQRHILSRFGRILTEFSNTKGVLVTRTIYIECYEQTRWEKTDILQHGFKLVRCRRNELSDGTLKSTVDLTMACEMMNALLTEELDEFVVVTSDSDFIPVLDWISRRRKSATVVVNHNHSPSFIRSVEDLGHQAVQIELLARRI